MSTMNRRRFLGTAGTLAALGRPCMAAYPAVVLVVDPADPVANSAPAKWAAQELERALTNAGSTVQRRRTLAEAAKDTQCVVVAGSRAAVAQDIQKRAGVSVPESPEALGLVRAGSSLLA